MASPNQYSGAELLYFTTTKMAMSASYQPAIIRSATVLVAGRRRPPSRSAYELITSDVGTKLTALLVVFTAYGFNLAACVLILDATGRRAEATHWCVGVTPWAHSRPRGQRPHERRAQVRIASPRLIR